MLSSITHEVVNGLSTETRPMPEVTQSLNETDKHYVRLLLNHPEISCNDLLYYATQCLGINNQEGADFLRKWLYHPNVRDSKILDGVDSFARNYVDFTPDGKKLIAEMLFLVSISQNVNIVHRDCAEKN